MDDATAVSPNVNNLYETAARLDSAEIVRRSAAYADEYDGLLRRLALVRCPPECLKLSEYMIDALTCCKKEVLEFGAYFATGDIEHLYDSQDYYDDAQSTLLKAANEWDRLSKD